MSCGDVVAQLFRSVAWLQYCRELDGRVGGRVVEVPAVVVGQVHWVQ